MRNLALIGLTAILVSTLPAVSAAQGVKGGQAADELNRQSAPAPANTVVTHDPVTGAPDTVVKNYPGNMVTTPPMDMNKSYPVCTAALQDNCQNRGEGGAPGRSRALNYWPGQPASD